MAEVIKLIQKFAGSISFSDQVRRLALSEVAELLDAALTQERLVDIAVARRAWAYRLGFEPVLYF
jgi:hypothetical protein